MGSYWRGFKQGTSKWFIRYTCCWKRKWIRVGEGRGRRLEVGRVGSNCNNPRGVGSLNKWWRGTEKWMNSNTLGYLNSAAGYSGLDIGYEGRMGQGWLLNVKFEVSGFKENRSKQYKTTHFLTKYSNPSSLVFIWSAIPLVTWNKMSLLRDLNSALSPFHPFIKLFNNPGLQ